MDETNEITDERNRVVVVVEEKSIGLQKKDQCKLLQTYIIAQFYCNESKVKDTTKLVQDYRVQQKRMVLSLIDVVRNRMDELIVDMEIKYPTLAYSLAIKEWLQDKKLSYGELAKLIGSEEDWVRVNARIAGMSKKVINKIRHRQAEWTHAQLMKLSLLKNTEAQLKAIAKKYKRKRMTYSYGYDLDWVLYKREYVINVMYEFLENLGKNVDWEDMHIQLQELLDGFYTSPFKSFYKVPLTLDL